MKYLKLIFLLYFLQACQKAPLEEAPTKNKPSPKIIVVFPEFFEQDFVFFKNLKVDFQAQRVFNSNQTNTNPINNSNLGHKNQARLTPAKIPLHFNKINPKLLNLLFKYGWDPNTLDTKGRTLLFKQARLCNTENVKILLANGAKPNIQSQNDFLTTALMQAVYNDCEAVTQLLLKYGANPDIQNKYGLTALKLTTNKRILYWLKKAKKKEIYYGVQ